LLSLAAIGGLVLLMPAAPAMADEDPSYRAPRVRTAPPPRMRMAPPPQRFRAAPPQRVRTVINTRAVWRTRTVCYDYNGSPFDCRNPAPVAPQPQAIGYTHSYTCGGCAAPAPVAPPVQYYAPPIAAPVQYYAPPVAAPCGSCAPAILPAPRYHSGCGGCAQPAPQYVYAPGHHGHGHYRQHGHPHGRYGYAAQ
jgi:hypothetical protein